MIDTTDWIHPVELGERRFLHPGPLRWLRALGWGLALFFLVALVSYGASALLGRVWDEVAKPVVCLIHVASAASCLGAYALLVWLAEGRRPSEIDLRFMLPQLGAGLLIGMVMFLVVMAILLLGGLYNIIRLDGASAWVSLGQAIKAGVLSELLIGGMLIRLVWRAFGPGAGFAACAALFGLGEIAHPAYTWPAALVFAVGASVLYGAFYALTGRLWMAMGVQMASEFARDFLFGARTNYGSAIATSGARPGLPEWLTGGQLGPIASVPALVVYALVGLVVYRMAWRAGQFARKA